MSNLNRAALAAATLGAGRLQQQQQRRHDRPHRPGQHQRPSRLHPRRDRLEDLRRHDRRPAHRRPGQARASRARLPPWPRRPAPPLRSCARSRSTTTIARWSTSPPTAATARSTARTSSATGVAGTGDGKIAGEEHIAFADDGTGRQNVTLMVQIPTDVQRVERPASSRPPRADRAASMAPSDRRRMGSQARLRRRLHRQGHGQRRARPRRQRGERDARAALRRGDRGHRLAIHRQRDAAELAAFNAAFPNRWAYKHAHSQQNPEKPTGDATRCARSSSRST